MAKEIYDPEDLESLMSERGFDELLEEERAFVLRHLSGRDEYERMRALLSHLRDAGRDQEPLEAHPVVKERVMAAFREAQQPTWRIWLNSLGGWLFPPQAQGFWRPALAFATLALVVTAGVLGYQRLADDRQQQVAEVRREKAEEPVPARTREQATEEPSEELNAELQRPAEAEAEGAAARQPIELAEVRSAEVVEDDAVMKDLDMEVAEEEPATLRSEAFAPAAADVAQVQPDSFTDEMLVTDKVLSEVARMPESQATYSADVQEVVVEAARTNRREKKESGDALGNVAMEDRSLAANPGIMALLQPGW